jgi:hypothetical protein
VKAIEPDPECTNRTAELIGHTRSWSESSHSTNEGVTGLLTSMVALTNASMMFGMQQMQNAWRMFSDSRTSLERVRHSLEAIADAMNSELSDESRSYVDRLNRAGSEAVHTSAEMMGADEDEEDQTGDHARHATETSGQTSHTTHSSRQN